MIVPMIQSRSSSAKPRGKPPFTRYVRARGDPPSGPGLKPDREVILEDETM